MMRNSRLNRYILSAEGHRSVFNATQAPRSEVWGATSVSQIAVSTASTWQKNGRTLLKV